MSFNDEVQAWQRAKAEERSRQERIDVEEAERAAAERAQHTELIEVARVRFEEEIRDLWRSAKEYWDANATPLHPEHARSMVPLLERLGHPWTKTDMTTRPLRLLMTHPQPGSSLCAQYEEQRAAILQAGIPIQPFADPTEAISINGWFALSAPGELRTFTKDAGEPAYVYETDESRAAAVGSGASPSFCMVFRGEEGAPDVAVRCTQVGPTEVYLLGPGGWENHGLLREHVISAVASLPLDSARRS